MKKPNYTEYPIYQILEDMAYKAGIKIEYDKLAKNIHGQSFSEERKIIMSSTNIYINDSDNEGGNNASFILAHEIAHTLVDKMYHYNEYDYDNDIVTYKFIDADADKIGGALYNLALMIYERNEEAKFEKGEKYE